MGVLRLIVSSGPILNENEISTVAVPFNQVSVFHTGISLLIVINSLSRFIMNYKGYVTSSPGNVPLVFLLQGKQACMTRGGTIHRSSAVSRYKLVGWPTYKVFLSKFMFENPV